MHCDHCAPLQQASFFASTSPDVFGFTNKMAGGSLGKFLRPSETFNLLVSTSPMMRSADGQRFYCWWHNGKSWYKAQRGRKGTHPEFPTPHPPGQSKILLDIFRWMQKNGSKNLWPGNPISLFFFEVTRWQVLFLLILFLVLLLLFCPGQPSPKLSMVLHHNLCESQPCAMNSWKKKKKWFLVARNLGLSLF